MKFFIIFLVAYFILLGFFIGLQQAFSTGDYLLLGQKNSENEIAIIQETGSDAKVWLEEIDFNNDQSIIKVRARNNQGINDINNLLLKCNLYGKYKIIFIDDD